MSASDGEAPFVCIVGAPRSGTTWLQAMIASHPRIATSHELKLFDLFTGPWEEAWQRLEALQRSAGGGPRGLRGVWSDEEFRSFLTGFVRDVHARVVARKPGADIVLDKSPGYSRHVEHIRRLVPAVRFIHLVRDGRDVAVSLRVAARGWARSWAPGTITSAAALWRSSVTAAREAGAGDPTRYLELRYEDLRADVPAGLAKAFSFVGVAVTPDQAATIAARHTIEEMQAGAGPFELPQGFLRSGRVGGWRDEMSPTERYLFEVEAGELLRALGYAERGWWIEHAHQRWLLPLLAAPGLRRRAERLARRLAPAAGAGRDA